MAMSILGKVEKTKKSRIVNKTDTGIFKYQEDREGGNKYEGNIR